ncbi:HAMP domain-containing histidine kinase [Trichothermofontia sichuanensis B231]|uniref:ATP-binding response regulator n=1 Tax=Trichothermofontia sichuanensis TaxID=3045816 RepID=UPI0022464B16|nr:HAMP domain-containing sensor histidine kinase [Trichothermofontia sichuanensis]UZQ52852.1 HAMP domain-containing histidine kinase [Trichothermofontia sichuanensis B231]
MLTAPYPSSPPPRSVTTDRILVVDDSPDNAYLIQAVLDAEGYAVEVAADGYTALRQVEREPPDLIMLDVVMPEMDGYEVTRRIRNHPRLPFVPILLITASDQPSVVRGLDLGADDFIRKPVEFDELLARVRSLLRLKHTIEERNQIARQREDFVSRLTHDLRTPLIAADRMLNLFLEGALGELTPQMKEVIPSMIRSNQNLLQMVNQLLEVYRYEAGAKSLAFSTVNLQDLLQEVVLELRPLATAKNIALGFATACGPTTFTRFEVAGDRQELRRVFTNLVGNAIKFTDRGAVKVVLGCVSPEPVNDPGPTQAWLVIRVKDTGPGIPAEEQATLFQRFRQGNHTRSGSGLGLHLSRQIVEAHGGTIEVESQVGRGSAFVVRLPALQT